MLNVPNNVEGENVVLLKSLQGYQLAKEQANRCNRNLLQYGAAIATILGIAAGSGSIFALADSVGKSGETDQSLPAWALGMLLTGAIILLVFLVLLLALLYRTFSLRDHAEHDADNYLSTLIVLGPERYWPKET